MRLTDRTHKTLTSDLIKSVRRLENLESAWQVIRSNGRASSSTKVRLELEEFAENSQRNLRSIQGRLARGSFKFEKAIGIPIPKLNSKGKKTGKVRPIVLAPVPSRIVQRALLNVLVEIPSLQPFVKTPYSFGGIRGNQSRRDLARSDRLSAVPAAINAVLSEIAAGARYVATADIQSFFTRISKEKVTEIASEAINDDEFIKFFRQAIDVELSNLAELRELISNFPTEDLGVAQGNSLSPLLGNIALAEFDSVMNEGDCRCIRYIDDIIILAPTEKAANARLRLAGNLLQTLSMTLSPEKTSRGSRPIDDGFEFLGISILPGLIRPSAKAQEKFIKSVKDELNQSIRSMSQLRHGKPLDPKKSAIATLARIEGMIDGWGKHYWFCNDGQIFSNLDVQISDLVRSYLGAYRSERSQVSIKHYAALLGLPELHKIKREPFSYPALGRSEKVN